MEINKVIVHELIKEKQQDIQPTNYRNAVLDRENEAVVKLLEGVIDIYGTRHNSAHYGTFVAGDGRGAFPDDFEGYRGLDGPTDDQFIALTRSAMGRLYDKASSSQFATGGYIVFSDFVSQQERFFLMAMIKKTPGLTLTEDLEPEELEQLDLSKLHQAAKINFSKMSEFDNASAEERRELNYLSFISSGSAKSASGYFVTALGCAPGTAPARATDNLLRESKKFFRENEGLRGSREDFVSELVGYLTEKEESGESVKLSEVGHIVTRNIPNALADQAEALLESYMERLNSEAVAVPAEFPVSKRMLNRYTRITSAGDSWKFSFEKSALGEDEAADVYYNRVDGTVTLTRIPESMDEAIREALDEFGQDEANDNDTDE
ncbi:nucleoid-associated protein [Halomonas sp. YLB-10]|uniref:nucleoid-associated protein n=1 Tax=Halomonas sp. YLB-10 TaxID=2483111 RepID=UPI001639B8EF|nr:nucleoid-associated protein [Halomonas sp. YLB-10]